MSVLLGEKPNHYIPTPKGYCPVWTGEPKMTDLAWDTEKRDYIPVSKTMPYHDGDYGKAQDYFRLIRKIEDQDTIMCHVGGFLGNNERGQPTMCGYVRYPNEQNERECGDKRESTCPYRRLADYSPA